MRFDQTLTLLWGDDSQAVGRSGLTVADFITAATAVLDKAGTTGFSMRAVAERLGVRTMAAYSFGKKEDLLALVVDRLYRDTYADGEEPTAADWRRGLTAVAEANRRQGALHPWLVELQTVRSLMGPWEMRKRDLELTPLESTGLTDDERDRMLTVLLLHVAGATRVASAVQRERAESGLTDDQWWRVVMPILERLADPATFPIAARVGLATQATRGGSPWGGAVYEFGLACLLDGFADLIEPGG